MAGLADNEQECIDMSAAVKAVEKIIEYTFKDKTLLEKALTHPSYVKSESYENLEHNGDAALGAMITFHFYTAFPKLGPGQRSLIRAANVSTENLARIAVRHGLYKYIRHNAASLDRKVKDFCEVVQQENGSVVHGGTMKAPKVLADIVEALVGAVLEDKRFDLKAASVVIGRLLEPLITLDMLQLHPQPVTMLFELCQKEGQQVDIKHTREGDQNIASVYIDNKFIASASSDQKENAKLQAAKSALEKLPHLRGKKRFIINEKCGIDVAKQVLHAVCRKKKWPKPKYSIVRMAGPAHDRKFVCLVETETADAKVKAEGEEMLRLKDAKGSAALLVLRGLQEHNYI